MAVPSSGQLRLYADIGTELGVAQSNVSLGAMSNTAGFPAPDAMSDFYGYSNAVPPTLITGDIYGIGTSNMILDGYVYSDGGGAIIERGFYFGTNSSSPTNNTKYTVGGSTGGMTLNRTGLSSNVTYYCWAFATNSAGTTYGVRKEGTTAYNYAFANFRFYGQMTTNNHQAIFYYLNINGGYTQNLVIAPPVQQVCVQYSGLSTTRSNKCRIMWGSNTSGNHQYWILGMGSLTAKNQVTVSPNIIGNWQYEPGGDQGFWGCNGLGEANRVYNIGGSSSGNFSGFTDGVANVTFDYN